MKMDLFTRRTAAHKQPPKWARLLVVAECDDGELYLPSLKRDDYWDRRLDLRRPAHWPYFLLSMATGWLLWIESYS